MALLANCFTRARDLIPRNNWPPVKGNEGGRIGRGKWILKRSDIILIATL